jgi:CheY-like chemotaxis protein
LITVSELFAPAREHAKVFVAAQPQPISGAAYHPRIFCVDDNPVELDVLEEAFAVIDGAAQVETTSSGHLAIARLCGLSSPPDGGLPDLLVIDVRMPLISGPDLLNGIRSQRELKTLRVVMLTGAADAAERGRCAALGALAVIEKPLDFAGYLHLARQLMSLARTGALPESPPDDDASSGLPTPIP